MCRILCVSVCLLRAHLIAICNMAIFYTLVLLWASVSAAPQLQNRFAPTHLPQQIQPFDYYLENQDVENYYNQEQQKQASSRGNGVPSKLETLDPDSEVELIPGAQQPQQPPQQTPVSPGLPGLLPGQRVFIVHMPVPGITPGTIGGYQPVYIVAAAPQGTAGYPEANGYQNPILLNPSAQGVLPSVLGYNRPGVLAQGVNPYLFGQSQLIARPFHYQEQPINYQQIPYLPGAGGGPVRFSQLIAIQGQRPASDALRSPAASNAELKQRESQLDDEKQSEELRLNSRPEKTQTHS